MQKVRHKKWNVSKSMRRHIRKETILFVSDDVSSQIRNPKYSKQNITIEELEKNSDIKKVDER